MATADLDRLKQEMLRQAVRHNVDLLEGGPPRSLRKGPRRVRQSIRILAIIVVPLVLFASVNAISTRADRPEVIVMPKDAAPSVPALAPEALARPQAVQPSVFRLGVRTIVLDPGHGGSDPGAQTSFGLSEKEVTLDIAVRLRELLAGAAFRVLMTREADESVPLRDRVAFANSKRGDLFVSIHINSIPSPDRRGVETYYLGTTDDPRVHRLAGEENRESGYSLVDYRRLLEGVLLDVRQGESRRFAQAVQQSLYTSLKKGNAELQNRGVKSAPFVVLIATEMPGVLAEVSCISNEEDARRLQDPDYRQGIARALFAGVSSYAEARNGPGDAATASVQKKGK